MLDNRTHLCRNFLFFFPPLIFCFILKIFKNNFDLVAVKKIKHKEKSPRSYSHNISIKVNLLVYSKLLHRWLIEIFWSESIRKRKKYFSQFIPENSQNPIYILRKSADNSYREARRRLVPVIQREASLTLAIDQNLRVELINCHVALKYVKRFSACARNH